MAEEIEEKGVCWDRGHGHSLEDRGTQRTEDRGIEDRGQRDRGTEGQGDIGTEGQREIEGSSVKADGRGGTEERAFCYSGRLEGSR